MGKESLLEAVRRCAVPKKINENDIVQRITSKLDRFFGINGDDEDMCDRFVRNMTGNRFLGNEEAENMYNSIVKNLKVWDMDILSNSEKYIDFYISLPKKELCKYSISVNDIHGVYITPGIGRDGRVTIPESLGTYYKFMSRDIIGPDFVTGGEEPYIPLDLGDSNLCNKDCRYMFEGITNNLLCVDLSGVTVDSNTDVSNMFNKCNIKSLTLNESFALAKGIENIFGDCVIIEKVYNCPDAIANVIVSNDNYHIYSICN